MLCFGLALQGCYTAANFSLHVNSLSPQTENLSAYHLLLLNLRRHYMTGVRHGTATSFPDQLGCAAALKVLVQRRRTLSWGRQTCLFPIKKSHLLIFLHLPIPAACSGTKNLYLFNTMLIAQERANRRGRPLERPIDTPTCF